MTKPDKVQVESDSDDSHDPDVQFSWDEQTSELPKELQVLWNRALEGEGKIDIRRLLEQHPRFAQLPAKAPDNNLLAEYRKKGDGFLKVVSQRLLNSLRLLASTPRHNSRYGNIWLRDTH